MESTADAKAVSSSSNSTKATKLFSEAESTMIGSYDSERATSLVDNHASESDAKEGPKDLRPSVLVLGGCGY